MPILSPDRNKSGNQPLQKGPFFIFLMMMPAFIVIIVMLLLIMQYKQLRSFVSPQPVELPKVESSREAQDRVNARLHEFLSAPPAAAPGAVTPALPVAAAVADTLALTSADLNDLIRSSEALEKLRLDYYLELRDTVLVARNSLPVERLIGPLATLAKVMRIKGYLNSEMRGYPSFEKGHVILVPVAAIMNGMPAPVSVLNAKGKLDLREWVGDKEDYDRAIAGLKDIRIRDGRLLLIRR